MRPLRRAQATAAAGTDHASGESYASYPFSVRPVPRPPQPLAQLGLPKTDFSHPQPKADRRLGLLTFTYHGRPRYVFVQGAFRLCKAGGGMAFFAESVHRDKAFRRLAR